ncbi:MAG: hypothetical protein MZW92_27105 [Comamonadaceae bacterium]|nr:hypothetical protein [Comamonadaceae bacterium]
MFMVAAVAVTAQSQEPGRAVAGASSHTFAVAACLFLATSASGLYETGQVKSISRTVSRAMLVALAAMPLTYIVFGLLPESPGDPAPIRLSMLAGVAAVIGRRAFVAHAAGQARNNRTRILIFGAGSAASDAAKALRADPRADIVGFVTGANERELAVPESEIVRGRAACPRSRMAWTLDEIVVALTERRAGSMPLRQLLDCKVSGVKVYDLNTHFEKTLGQIRVDYLSASWLIFGDGFNQDAGAHVWSKRGVGHHLCGDPAACWVCP